MGSSQNWLAFSLSPLEMPNNTSHPHVDSSHLCLVEAFNSNGWSNQNRSVERVEDESGDLSMITAGGHKLEDFLGGASLGRFSGNPTSESSAVYDSHPKTIAAGCLQVFSTVQTSTDQSELGKAILPVELVSKKSIDTFGQRTSIYRGVTRHRWTGRYEAHLWDNSCRREGQSRKGRQVYLGGYDKEEKAARAYDLAALKYWGLTTTTNFPVSNYEKELEEMKNMTRQQFVASLRRKSSGFSRGASIYRGVTRHHQHGRWQARIGRVAGNKDLYLGTFSTQEEAAAAYDIAAIKFRGLNAVTNFDMSRYDVQSIVSSDLPIGGVTNGIKTSESSDKGSETKHHDDQEQASFTSQLEPLSFSLPIKPDQDCPLLAFQNPAQNTAKNTHFQHSTNGSAFQRLSNLEPPVTLDFSTIYGINQIQSHGFVNGGGLFLQNLTIPPALAAGPRNLHYLYQQPSTFVRSTTNCDNSSYTNWVTPSVHAFQAARPNLAVIQTPIFSME